jgi:CDP-glycerol glycerophosphotransferase
MPFDYVNFSSQIISRKMEKKRSKVKIIQLGYPRVDVLKKNLSNKMLHYLGFKNFAKKKIIYYTPTWRIGTYDLPLINLSGFDYYDFEKFLLEENLLFFYTLHTGNLPSTLNISNRKSIFYIDPMKKPFFDTTKFLTEVNILINDYSSTSTEASLIKVPQIFVSPDLREYKKNVGFLMNYEKSLTGPLAKNYQKLKEYIKLYITKPSLHNKKFNKKMKLSNNFFYGNENQNSKSLWFKFLKELI